MQLGYYTMFALKANENTYYQAGPGVLETYSATEVAFAARSQLEIAEVRTWWLELRGQFTPEYASYVDEIIEDIEQQQAAA